MPPPPPDQHKPLPPTPTSPSAQHRPNLLVDTSSNETVAASSVVPSVVLDTPSSFGTPYMDSEDSPEEGYSGRRNGEATTGGGLEVGLEVEPPLGAVSSTSSSSPTRPLFTWPANAPATMVVNSSDLAPSTSSSSTHVRRDPFDDDGVNTFADDPFAHDGSDPEDPNSAGAEPRRRPESGGDDTGDESGGDRARQRSTEEEGAPILLDEGDVPRPYDPYGRPFSAAIHYPSSGLLPPSPPPFLRAFSAPVATSRLGNLVHPGRRPSQSNTNSRPSHLSPSISINSNDYPTRPSYQSHQSRTASVSSNLSNSTTNDHLASDSVSSSSRLDPPSSSSSPPTPPPTGLYTLSLELADSVQAAIQTLLQLTPPHLFDTAKEQFSACTVQMPATSLTSLLTAMKNLNYLSEHIAPLCADESLLHSPSHSRASTPSHLPTFSEDGLAADPSISTSRPFPSPFGTSRASFGAESMTSLQTIASEPSSMLQDFDIGEMVQSVGDLLGGLTAQAGVDLVLFHGDVGMKHFSVKADEGGVCYVLSHVVRQVLLTAQPGDAIEIGLHVAPQSPSSRLLPLPLSIDDLSQRNRTLSSISDSPNDASHDPGPLLCTFEIIHNIATADAPARTPMTEKGGDRGGFPGFTPMSSQEGDEVDRDPLRPLPDLPNLSSPLTTKLVKHVSGALRLERSVTSVRRRFELALLLDRGSPLVEPANLPEEELALRQPFPSLELAREPTLAELQIFAETLRGKKVAFHASETSVFAKHLTSYLTAWGMDMRHISTETEEEEEEDLVGEDLPSSGSHGNAVKGDSGYGGSSSGSSSPLNGGGASSSGSSLPNGSSLLSGIPQPFEMVTSPLARGNTISGSGLGLAGMTTTEVSGGGVDRDASFIIIDDDVLVLRRRLTQLRMQTSPSLSLRPRSMKRPSMASRARSSPQIRQLLPIAPPQNARRGIIIIHFTSLANYNVVRDAIQSILTPGSANSLPEVMVIPKPVGPRRFLTALHTAVHRPVVDPYFTPIATSPLSLSVNYGSGFSYFPAPPPLTSSSPKDDSDERSRLPGSRVVSAGNMSASMSGPLSRPPVVGALDSGGSLHLAIPSPDISNPIDFLADTANKFGQSARSGMLIQSPDGMPMGMFFDPPPRTPNSRRSSVKLDKEASERRRTSGSARPPIATFVSSIDSVIKSAGSPPPGLPPRGSKSASELPVGTPGSPLSPRREGFFRHGRGSGSADFDAEEKRGTVSSSASRGSLRRTPSQESKSSSHSRSATTLDRAESSSSTSVRASRSKTSSSGSAPPGVLAHRSSTGSGSGGRARSPSGGAEEPSSTPRQGHSPREVSSSSSLKSPPLMSPPRPDSKPEESILGEDVVPAPPPPTVKKSSKKSGSDKLKKKAKDDGMIVPPINVLIVEDNPINQTILSTFMKKKKIKFGVANNGLEAVEMWKTGGFHLILMDIQLPVMDGIEATREIRKLEKQHNIGVFPSTPTSEIVRTPSPSVEAIPTSPFRSSVIIVALTASSLQSDRVSALAAGCNDFLTKPVSLKWLEKKIVEWGSMQALIDFDGWRRWRGADHPKTDVSDAAKGFGVGADMQARALRSRLKIDRGPGRTSPKPATSPPLVPPSDTTAAPPTPPLPSETFTGPDIHIQQPTPHSLVDGEKSPLSSPSSPSKADVPLAPPGTMPAQEVLPDRPPSPINDKAVPASTLANVPVSGSEALQQHLERAAEEQRQETMRDKLGYPIVLGGRRRAASSTQSIASLQFVTTPVGENPPPIWPNPEPTDSSSRPSPPRLSNEFTPQPSHVPAALEETRADSISSSKTVKPSPTFNLQDDDDADPTPTARSPKGHGHGSGSPEPSGSG